MLEPGEHYVIWADGDATQGPRHASFRLGASGEEVGVFDRLRNGNVLIDWVVFGPQEPDASLGRVPDGTGEWVPIHAPSPGLRNDP